MSIEALFDHTCNVFHIQSSDTSVGYGLPADITFAYGDMPDIEAVSCHFSSSNRDNTVMQATPMSKRDASKKLVYPMGVEIKVNDKIVHLETGLVYTADIPVCVRNHHNYVMVYPRNEQGYL